MILIHGFLTRSLRQELEKVRFELEAQGEGGLTTTSSCRANQSLPIKATFYKSVVGVR
jgi:hypothetical protein